MHVYLSLIEKYDQAEVSLLISRKRYSSKKTQLKLLEKANK